MNKEIQLQWSGFVEKYTYASKEAQLLHKKEMESKGFEDTGLSVCGVPDKNGVYRRVLTGECRKYNQKRSKEVK